MADKINSQWSETASDGLFQLTFRNREGEQIDMPSSIELVGSVSDELKNFNKPKHTTSNGPFKLTFRNREGEQIDMPSSYDV